jgi:hypothetical protein
MIDVGLDADAEVVVGNCVKVAIGSEGGDIGDGRSSNSLTTSDISWSTSF